MQHIFPLYSTLSESIPKGKSCRLSIVRFLKTVTHTRSQTGSSFLYQSFDGVKSEYDLNHLDEASGPKQCFALRNPKEARPFFGG